jgi:hypothetical protein
MSNKLEIQPVHCSLYVLEDFEDRKYTQTLVEKIMSSSDIFSPTKYKNIKDKVVKIDCKENVISFLTDELSADKYDKNKPRHISVDLYNSKTEYSINWSKSHDECNFQLIYIELKIKYELDFSLDSSERFKLMSIDSKDQKILNDFLNLVKTIIPVINPVYGEFSDLTPIYSTNRPFNLKLRLPDTQQISIYGTPYINLFSRKKIESAPFEKIEQLGSEHYWLEATSSVFESVSVEKKRAIREHFGEEYFMDGGKERLPSGKKRYTSGIAPLFDFRNCRLGNT